MATLIWPTRLFHLTPQQGSLARLRAALPSHDDLGRLGGLQVL
jgi:hypothetical protein